MSKRIAFLRIAQETNALSPVLTSIDDFRRTHFFEHGDLLDRCQPRGEEAPGFLRNAELSGFVKAMKRLAGDEVELVPMFSAWMIPAGPLTEDAVRWFLDRIRREFEAAGHLDGVYVSLHGAMRGVVFEEPEADFLETIRKLVGPDVPVVASLDLHAQMSRRKADTGALFLAYHTNPHRDHASTGARCADVLYKAVTGQARPVMAWRTLPMVLGGGFTLDFLAPMRGVFRYIRRVMRHPKVMDASALMVQLWNDDKHLGWACTAIVDGDTLLAEEVAHELAHKLWSVRHHMPPLFPTADEAMVQIRRAKWARRLGTICLSDASDMVGAGAVGENTRLLRTLLEEGEGMRIFATVRDEEVVEALWGTSEGARVEVEVGGKICPELSRPLPVEGVVRGRSTDHGFGRRVLLDLGHMQLIVTEGPPLAMKPMFYRSMGLKPMKADVVMVKSLFPFRLFFLCQNRKTIYARTRGMTDFDAPYRVQFAHPVHPVHPVSDWQTVDALRRGAWY